MAMSSSIYIHCTFVFFLIPLSTPLSNGDLFFSGSNAKEGLLQIHFNNVNMTVCSSGFSTLAADIACRELGFIKALHFNRTSSDPKYNSSGMILSINDCSAGGTELYHLLRCSFTLNDCPNNESVILTCDKEKLRESPYNTQVQLVRRNTQPDVTVTPSKGVLQVYLNGEWGDVCHDNGFSQDAANSVCLQKGFTNAVTTYSIHPNQDSAVWSLTGNCKSSQSCFHDCFNYPQRSDVVDDCVNVVGIQCTFNTTLKDKFKPGSTKLCTLNMLYKTDRDLHKIFVGVLITSIVLILIIIVVILLTCYFYTKCPIYMYRKRRHYRAII